MLTIQHHKVSNTISSFVSWVSTPNFSKPLFGKSPIIHQDNDSFEATQPSLFRRFDSALQEYYDGSIHQLIIDSAKENNLIGQGSGASVYCIPKMPDFVLRVWHGIDTTHLPPLLPPKIEAPLPILVGWPVVSYNQDDFQVLPYQAGITSPVFLTSLFRKHGLKKLFATNGQEPLPQTELITKRPLYAQHLKYVVDMSQAAYDDFARKLKILNSFPNVHFDPNIRNVLADKSNNTFNLVDLWSWSGGLGPYKNVIGMAGSLVDSMFINLDETSIGENGEKSPGNVAEDVSLAALRHAILEKTFLAAYRVGLDVPKEDWPDMPLAAQKFLGQKRYYLDANYICRLSGFDWQKVKALLQQTTISYVSEEKFLQQLDNCTLANPE